ncbi:uncharacterized protein C8orf59 homolog [Microtus ochrogaster]|uniref:Uncharacterized protein C8orf59 homolog n=1 Tax=Microtus ochrogaster TaxID=79684 RepID=A0ABM0KKQ1_MICOH|nr:uncharacterized protein C8orf59 homolog [Microtus ochrogaster]
MDEEMGECVRSDQITNLVGDRLAMHCRVKPQNQTRRILGVELPSEMQDSDDPWSLTVAKNKLKCQKFRKVFHITSHKNSKAKKAKPGITHIKMINVMKDEKVNRMNRTFVNIQKELVNFSKSLSLKSKQKEPRPHEREPANVGKAARLIVTNTLFCIAGQRFVGGRCLPQGKTYQDILSL